MLESLAPIASVRGIPSAGMVQESRLLFHEDCHE